jgi:hypothetical protein
MNDHLQQETVLRQIVGRIAELTEVLKQLPGRAAEQAAAKADLVRLAYIDGLGAGFGWGLGAGASVTENASMARSDPVLTARK